MAIETYELAHGRIVVCAVHDHIAPTTAEWDAYVDAARRTVARVGAERSVGLAITDGGSPDAQQRQQVITMLNAETGGQVDRLRSAVVSESLVVRTVVGAFSLLMKDIQLFAPSASWRALEFIQVTDEDVPELRRGLEVLSARVPGARAVRAVIDALARPEDRST